MKAADVMTRDPVVVTPETPLKDAARLMKDEDVGMLPVVRGADSRDVVGVVTDRDIATRCVALGHDSSRCKVTEVMTRTVQTARESDDIETVMDLMGRERIRRIPIVDERGSLVGVVAQADIARKADDDSAERTVERISEPGRNKRSDTGAR